MASKGRATWVQVRVMEDVWESLVELGNGMEIEESSPLNGVMIPRQLSLSDVISRLVNISKAYAAKMKHEAERRAAEKARKSKYNRGPSVPAEPRTKDDQAKLLEELANEHQG